MFQSAHPTDDNLTSWFGNGVDRNIGIVTGKISGLVVVDTDNAEAEAWANEHLPATPMMCKTAKGMHRYYRHPGTEVRNGARITTADGTFALDVRGDGGYVVAPGSTHPTGTIYTAPSKWPASLDDVPVFSPSWLAAPLEPRVSPTTAAGETIPAGERNARLTSEAGAMQRRGMSEGAILAALRVENELRCVPPLQEREIAAIAKSVGRYTPEDAPTLRPIVLLNDAELLMRPPLQAVVDERLFSRTLVTLYGPPGIGKSFVAQDLAYCVASGLPWLDASVTRSGPVVYVAAEGDAGLTLRVRAWKTFHDLPLDQPTGVWTAPQAVNLIDAAEIGRLVDAIGALTPQMVVFDTLARCLIGGDENSSKDVGILVNNCDRIRTDLDTVVLLIHHSQKNGPAERGSSALRGACDTMLELSSVNDLLTLSCDKQKDGAMPFRPLSLALHVVPGTDSCVARLASNGEQSKRLTAGERRALAALRDSFMSEGATSTDWLNTAQVAGRSFYRVQKRLVGLGYVRKEGRQYVWTGKEPEDN